MKTHTRHNYPRTHPMTYNQQAEIVRRVRARGYTFKLRTALKGLVCAMRLNPVAERVAFICLAGRYLQGAQE